MDHASQVLTSLLDQHDVGQTLTTFAEADNEILKLKALFAELSDRKSPLDAGLNVRLGLDRTAPAADTASAVRKRLAEVLPSTAHL